MPPTVPVTPAGPILPPVPPRPRAAPECRTPAELFDVFAAAFAAGDVDRIADCYTAPAYVVTNARTVVFTTRTEIVDGFAAAREQYRTSGLTSATCCAGSTGRCGSTSRWSWTGVRCPRPSATPSAGLDAARTTSTER